MEEKYRRGEIQLDALNMIREDISFVNALVDQSPDDDEQEDNIDANRIVEYSLQHTTYGNIRITNQGSRHWRKATTDDIGAIVYCKGLIDPVGVFGELDGVEEEEDEEFPEETKEVAIVYTQDGNMIKSSHAQGSVWDDISVVPDQVLRGVKDEAPPGSFFSGSTAKNSSQWSPSPDGQVFWNRTGQYHDDFNYFVMKRKLENLAGMFDGMSPIEHLEHEIKIWNVSGRFALWDPVDKKFISEGAMFRLAHWFHNGDGSAQQRKYYTQNEILEKYGGLKTVPLKCNEEGILVFENENDKESENIIVETVRTSNQAIRDRIREAERNGSVVNLT